MGTSGEWQAVSRRVGLGAFRVAASIGAFAAAMWLTDTPTWSVSDTRFWVPFLAAAAFAAAYGPLLRVLSAPTESIERDLAYRAATIALIGTLTVVYAHGVYTRFGTTPPIRAWAVVLIGVFCFGVSFRLLFAREEVE